MSTTELQDTQDANVKKLPQSRRKTTRVSQESLVKTGFVSDASALPLLVQPSMPGIDLTTWATNNRAFVESHLDKHGAILFRDFNVGTPGEFERFVAAMSGELLEYRERSSPRRKVSGSVYTSTDYPAAQSIFPHNENSYSHVWPLKVYFFCETPAREGGETPLVDSRRIYARIPPEIRARFEEKWCMYVRNFGGGLGLDWQNVFQTEDKTRVEDYCRRAGIEHEWLGGDRLRTRHVRPATAKHPRTGDAVWFNHATFFHVSTLEASIRETMLAGVKLEDVPNNTYYGDGSEIEPAVLDVLREAYRQEMVVFPWQRGDVLMVDNMLTAHARNPFEGERRVLVAMAEPFSG